jgi:hypothetical protein
VPANKHLIKNKQLNNEANFNLFSNSSNSNNNQSCKRIQMIEYKHKSLDPSFNIRRKPLKNSFLKHESDVNYK